MALTESSLLSNFLVSPAPLAVSLSLQQFTELFPKSRQGDATIPALYHELQKQRTQDIERVKQNIAAETKRGMSQQRHIGRIRQARLRQELWDDAAELTIEAKLFPEHANEEQRKAHTIESLVPEMEQAIADIEDEIVELEKETQSTFADVQATVGDLSDLRYGRFSKTPRVSGRDLSTEVSEGLWRIQQLCEDAGKG